MTLFVWILLGLVAGFIASHIVNHRGEGIVLDVLLGMVGAFVGGWLFRHIRPQRGDWSQLPQHPGRVPGGNCLIVRISCDTAHHHRTVAGLFQVIAGL